MTNGSLHRNLRIEQSDDGLARVTLQSAVLNRQTLDELGEAVQALGQDDQVRAVVLTGDGAVFLGDLDPLETAAFNPRQAKAFARRGQAVTELIEGLGKPVIAAVNGSALGSGCEIALACTVRLAAATASFGHPGIVAGVMPALGATQRLSRLVGRGPALELLLTGETIAAAQAQRIGLVNHVYEPPELAAAADALARRMSAHPACIVGYCLEAVRHGLEMPQSDGLMFEANLFGLCFTERMKEEG